MPAVTLEYEIHTCPSERCGVTFALPKAYVQRRREDGASFWCPSGHSMSFSKTEADRLRENVARLEEEKASARRERDSARAAREDAERRARRAEAKLRKLTPKTGG